MVVEGAKCINEYDYILEQMPLSYSQIPPDPLFQLDCHRAIRYLHRCCKRRDL